MYGLGATPKVGGAFSSPVKLGGAGVSRPVGGAFDDNALRILGLKPIVPVLKTKPVSTPTTPKPATPSTPTLAPTPIDAPTPTSGPTNTPFNPWTDATAPSSPAQSPVFSPSGAAFDADTGEPAPVTTAGVFDWGSSPVPLFLLGAVGLVTMLMFGNKKGR